MASLVMTAIMGMVAGSGPLTSDIGEVRRDIVGTKWELVRGWCGPLTLESGSIIFHPDGLVTVDCRWEGLSLSRIQRFRVDEATAAVSVSGLRRDAVSGEVIEFWKRPFHFGGRQLEYIGEYNEDGMPPKRLILILKPAGRASRAK